MNWIYRRIQMQRHTGIYTDVQIHTDTHTDLQTDRSRHKCMDKYKQCTDARICTDTQIHTDMQIDKIHIYVFTETHRHTYNFIFQKKNRRQA